MDEYKVVKGAKEIDDIEITRNSDGNWVKA